jgi:hypothetical protein
LGAPSSLLPVPEAGKSKHPAYPVAFEAYLRAGCHMPRAKEILEEFWDPDLYGADLPSDVTLRRWAREDDWRGVIREYGLQYRPKIRQTLNTDITIMMPDMLHVLQDIAHDRNDDHAKINSVRQAAAAKLLQYGAVGIYETRYGEPPNNDVDTEAMIKRVQAMTPDEIIEMQMERMASGEDNDGT